MGLPNKSNALFFLVSLEEGNALLQPLYAIHYSNPRIACTTHPAAKCPVL